MKFTLENARKFGWDGLSAWAYNTREDFSGASAAYFEVTGEHGKVKTALSDRVYLVLDGMGEYIISGDVVSVQKHDVVIVPKNTPYNYKALNGTVLKLFLVHAPAYNQDFEEKI